MMFFFPILHENELLYSGIARYHEHSGNLSLVHTIIDVFSTRNAVATVALPSRIRNIVENLTTYDEEIGIEIIVKHTLLNFYSAFKSEELYSQVEQDMLNTSGIGIHMKLGMVSSSIRLERSLKYCPICVKNDNEAFGEPFWHREHQIFGAVVCHNHFAILQYSDLPVFGRNRRIFYRLTPEICKMEPQYLNDKRKLNILVRLAVEINILCNCRVNLSLTDFKNRLKVLLYEKGYFKPYNYTCMKKLTVDIQDYYSNEVLELIGCSLEKQNWVNAIRNPRMNVGQPIHILLLLHFLGYTVNSFKDMKNLEDTNINEYIQELWDEKLILLLNEDLSLQEICRELGATRRTIMKALERMNLEKEWK